MTCSNLIVIKIRNNTQLEEILAALNTNCIDAVILANRSPWSVNIRSDIISTSGKRVFDGSDFIINVDYDIITMQFKSGDWDNGNRFIVEDLIVKKFNSIISCAIKTIKKRDRDSCNDPFTQIDMIMTKEDGNIAWGDAVIGIEDSEIRIADPKKTLWNLFFGPKPKPKPMITTKLRPKYNYEAVLIEIKEEPFLITEIDELLQVKLEGNDINIIKIIKSYLFERRVSNTRTLLEIPHNPDNVDSRNNTKDLDTDFYELGQNLLEIPDNPDYVDLWNNARFTDFAELYQQINQ